MERRDPGNGYRTYPMSDNLRWLEELPWGNSPEDWINAGAVPLKRSRSRFSFAWAGERRIFIKRYCPHRLSSKCLSWIRGTKSGREARVLARLRKKGIDVPEPLAVVTPIRGIGRMPNYLVEEHLNGYDLRTAARASPQGAWVMLASIAADLGTLLARMHAIGFFHPDTSLHNFFLEEPSKVLHAVDVDGGRFLPRILRYHRRKNLSQIIRSGKIVTEREDWIELLYNAYVSCSGIPLEAIRLT